MRSDRKEIEWFMENFNGGTYDLQLCDQWAPCLGAWKAMSCCSRGRLASAPFALTSTAGAVKSEIPPFSARYYGDGMRDATAYIQALIDKGSRLHQGTYRISSTLKMRPQ